MSDDSTRREYHFCRDSLSPRAGQLCWRVAYKLAGTANYWYLSEPFSSLPDAQTWVSNYDDELQRLASKTLDGMRQRALEMARGRHRALKVTQRQNAKAAPRKPLARGRKSDTAKKSTRKRAP